MHNTKSYSLALSSKISFRARLAREFGSILLFVLLVAVPPSFAQQAARPQEQDDAGSRKTNESSDSRSATNPSATETLVDQSLSDDPAVLKMLEPYRARVRDLETVIGRLEGELRKTRIGAGSLGNFVTDALRAEADRKLGKRVAVTISNAGGMRKNSIAPGELRVRDIFELLPFENKLIAVDVTGEQLLKLLSVVLLERDAQSGAHITYRLTADDRPEFVTAKLITADGKEQAIDPRAVYRVATIDYLYNLKSGRYSILRDGAVVTPLNVMLRDALVNYVKTENAKGRTVKAILDDRFTQVGPSPKEGVPQ